MPRLLDLLASSVLVQGILTLAIVAADLYLFIVDRPVPAELWGLTSLVIGFYFGAKVQNGLHAAQLTRPRKQE